MLTAKDFFDLSAFRHADLFRNDKWVWQAVADLGPYLDQWFAGRHRDIRGEIADTARLHGDHIYIGEGTVVEDGACIVGPAIIGKNCEIRQGAYVRGNAILGDGAVLGHASEMKNSVMLNDAKAPHFAYVGDSILGVDVNLGAGTKLSNLTVVSKKDLSGKRPTIHLTINGERVDTGLAKLGAIVGDHTQTGCNSVTNPGTLLGRHVLVYPNLSVSKGFYADNSILKLRQAMEVISRREGFPLT
jgi:UDP-N-acetylglucosamine diphosphorylase / glucose-1-phosphate thymidylyltransferase / UDP-N-acetylgalactosamine diphosphorylase / glucosamine-1-phosphate N-acetyltransferase / galactosamine-1-phosphate N-acetyltransferase